MQRQYKLEVFDSDINFKSMAPIPQPVLTFDYLSPESNTIQARNIKATKGDYVHITDINGACIMDGIVKDVETTKDTSIITFNPLLSLFDVDVYFDRKQSGIIEPFLLKIITETFISNSDALQNMPFVVSVYSSTPAKLNLKDNIHSLLEIIQKAFVYGVVVDLKLLPQQKVIEVTISRQTDTFTLESKLALNKNIVIADVYGLTNKITIFDKTNEANKVTYYLHTNGTIDTTDADRIVPVFFKTEFLETEDFFEDAKSRAKEVLRLQKFQNLIELLFRNGNKIIPAMAIGAEVNIDGYQSIYTGYVRTGETTKYIFGMVRLELTKLLRRADL